jgi:hypothetical protein
MAPFGDAQQHEKAGVDNLYIPVNWRGRGLVQLFDSMVFKRGDMVNWEFKIAD